jgi:hypothetical protein
MTWDGRSFSPEMLITASGRFRAESRCGSKPRPKSCYYRIEVRMKADNKWRPLNDKGFVLDADAIPGLFKRFGPQHGAGREIPRSCEEIAETVVPTLYKMASTGGRIVASVKVDISPLKNFGRFVTAYWDGIADGRANGRW